MMMGPRYSKRRRLRRILETKKNHVLQKETKIPEVGHKHSYSKTCFRNTEQAVSGDVRPVNVPSTVDVVMDKRHDPASKEENL